MLSKSDLAARYIALLKKSLINELYIENEARIVLVVDSLLNRRPFELGHLYGIDREAALFSLLDPFGLLIPSRACRRRRIRKTMESILAPASYRFLPCGSKRCRRCSSVMTCSTRK